MDELKRGVTELDNHVQRLILSVDQLRGRQVRVERNARMLVAVLLLVAALAGMAFYTAFREMETSRQLQETAAAQAQTQAQLRLLVQDVVCPIVGLAVGNYRPELRKEGPERDAYIRGWELTRDSYRRLDCTTPTPGPAQPSG